MLSVAPRGQMLGLSYYILCSSTLQVKIRFKKGAIGYAEIGKVVEQIVSRFV